MSNETPIYPKSLYLTISQEFYQHQKMLQESSIDSSFKFSDLIIHPSYYAELMGSPELSSYGFIIDYDSPEMFPGISIRISPLVKTWKWACDFV